MSAQHFSFRGSLDEYYFRVTWYTNSLSVFNVLVTEIGKLCFCLLICRARTFLSFTELLTQNPTMAEFYLGNSWLISRSAEHCLGHITATQGQQWSQDLTWKWLRKYCCWLWWQKFFNWLTCQTKLKVRCNSQLQTCWVNRPCISFAWYYHRPWL